MNNQELNLGHLAEEFAKLLIDVPQTNTAQAPVQLEEGERREVTILFLDLVGYTRLAERLDPEQLKFVVSNTLQVFTNQVKKFGGTVEKFIGDAVMALFGRAQAYEDDSRRAVAAARAILERLDDINSILAQRGIKLHARIGINRGLIVTGQLAEHETVTGEAINVAQRLEANAPEDGILISEPVYRDCALYYRCEELGPLHVKNKTEPLAVYRIWEELAAPSSAARPAAAGPFVGREGELAAMQTVMERARNAQMSILQITGEAGIGKSRLTHEFVDCLRATPKPPTIVYVVAESFGQPPYHALSDLLREYLEQVQCDLGTFITNIADTAVQSGVREYQVYLHDLLGLPLTTDEQAALEVMEPRARQAETLLALKRFLAAAAAWEQGGETVPLLMIVDNQQWVAHASRDAIGQLLQTISSDLPLLWMFVGRPAEVGQWLPPSLSVTTLNLTSLSLDAVEEFMHTQLPDRELTVAFCRQILERTGGNPLFLGEVVNALTRLGDISHFSLEEILPGSIKALVLSRLDRLPRPQKFTLQVAAVAGREFSRALLAHIIDRVQYQYNAHILIDELMQTDLLAAAPTEGTFVISQPMVAEVAYTTVLHANRRKLHGLVATWIEEQHRQNVRPYAAFLAEQWARAEEADKAITNYIEAGFSAKARYAYRDAVVFFEKALKFLTQSTQNAATEQLGIVYVTLVHLYEALSNVEAQERLIREGIGTLPAGEWSVAALQLHAFRLRYERGDTVGVAEALPTFAKDPAVQAFPDVQIDCHALLGLIAWERGQDASPSIDAALALRPQVEARMAQYDDTKPFDRYRLATDASTIYKIDYVVFNHYKNINELKKAEAYFYKVLEASETKHTFAQHMAHLFYCSLMWDRGVEFKNIALRAALARSYFREIGWARGVGWGAFYRGAALWRMGQFAEAHHTFTETLQYMERVNDTYVSGKLELLLAAVFLARGDAVGYQLRKKRIAGKAEALEEGARLALQRELAMFEGQCTLERHELAKVYEELMETVGAPMPRVEADEYIVTVALVAAQLGHHAEATKKLAEVRARIEQNEKKWLMGLMARVDGLMAAAKRDVEATHRAFGASVVHLQAVGALYDCHVTYQQWWRAIEQLGMAQSPKGDEVRRRLTELEPGVTHGV